MGQDKKNGVKIQGHTGRIARLIIFTILLSSLVWGAYDIWMGNKDLIIDRFCTAAISLSALIFYKRLRLNLAIVLLGLVPVGLHSAGLYDAVWLGIPFDHYLHFCAGFMLALVFLNMRGPALQKKSNISAIAEAAVVMAVVSGIGSFMEILEFFGAKYGGAGSGIFFYGEGDYGTWNAHKDMINNTLGALWGATAYLVLRSLRDFQHRNYVRKAGEKDKTAEGKLKKDK